jgi:hypothetical protein
VIGRTQIDKVKDVEMEVPPVVEEFKPKKMRKLLRPGGGTLGRIVAKLREKSNRRLLFFRISFQVILKSLQGNFLFKCCMGFRPVKM